MRPQPVVHLDAVGPQKPYFEGVPVTPPKPYKIVADGPGCADIYLRVTPQYRIGEMWQLSNGEWRASGAGKTLFAPTRAEAAALVYQAWLDRTSEGSKK